MRFLKFEVHANACSGDTYFDSVGLSPASRVSTTRFDDATHSFPVTVTGEDGHVVESDYDAFGRVTATRAKDTTGSTEATELAASTYDAAGRLLTSQTAPGLLDSEGRSITATFTYSPGGRLESVTNPRGGVTSLGYDAAGRLTTVTTPAGRVSALSYDAAGRLATTYRPRQGTGPLTTMSVQAYDGLGRASATTYFDESGTVAASSTATYDAYSRAATVTLSGSIDGTGQSWPLYDAADRVVGSHSTGPVGSIVTTMELDAADAPTRVHYKALSTSGTITNVFAKTGQWLSTSDGARRFGFAWDAQGALASVSSSDAARSLAFERDTGRLARVTTSYRASGASASGLYPYGDYALGYDALGRIACAASKVTSVPTVAEGYGYDTAGRLTSWSRGGDTTDYEYDAAGNLEKMGAASLQVDADDRLVKVVQGSVETTYGNDDLGRRVSRSGPGGATGYGYDALGHLSSVTSSNTASTYIYGIGGMRNLKTVESVAGTTTTTKVTKTVWSGNHPLLERDSLGASETVLYRYTYGPGGDPLSLAVETSAGVRSYLYQLDALGDVVALTDASGTVAATYSYDPWGNVVSVGGADQVLRERQPLRYRSYYLDSDTGLYYLPARYYDPAVATFLTPDPASPTAGDPGSLNRYTYCGGDPVQHRDNSGADYYEDPRQMYFYQHDHDNKYKARVFGKPWYMGVWGRYSFRCSEERRIEARRRYIALLEGERKAKSDAVFKARQASLPAAMRDGYLATTLRSVDWTYERPWYDVDVPTEAEARASAPEVLHATLGPGTSLFIWASANAAATGALIYAGLSLLGSEPVTVPGTGGASIAPTTAAAASCFVGAAHFGVTSGVLYYAWWKDLTYR